MTTNEAIVRKACSIVQEAIDLVSVRTGADSYQLALDTLRDFAMMGAGTNKTQKQ